MDSKPSEDFFMDDDFNAIIDVLETDEEVEKHIDTITPQEIVKIEHICSLCDEWKYKTLTGLRKHNKSIHQAVKGETSEVLTITLLLETLNVKLFITGNKTYPKTMVDDVVSSP